MLPMQAMVISDELASNEAVILITDTGYSNLVEACLMRYLAKFDPQGREMLCDMESHTPASDCAGSWIAGRNHGGSYRIIKEVRC